jgi:two-component system, cell cycle sensor histidine kinase and response regulator CckA
MEYMAAVVELNGARKNTILLVDDESAIMLLLELELTRMGYYVLTAGNAQEAKRVTTEFQSTIDLLITDWRMPGMTGDQLACDLLVERPNLKIILISGYSEAEAVCRAFHEGQLEFLLKPFGIDELNAAIRRLLGLSDKADRQVA